jgi:hypothetical protein
MEMRAGRQTDRRTSLAGVAAVLIYPWLKRIGMIQPQLSSCSETHQVTHNEPKSPGELGVAQAYRKAIKHIYTFERQNAKRS